jgi:hypothetical protein
MNEPDDLQAADHHADPAVTDGVPFEQAARDAMHGLSAALSDLLAALPVAVERAVDVERALDLDKKLAWQVFRLARATSTAEVAKVPAARSIRRLLAHARKRRVPAGVVERVGAEFERFESFAVSHAGDREALASMVRGMSDEADEQEEVRLRRTLFRANAHVWGLRMRQFVRSTIFLPPARDPPAPGGEIMLSAHLDLEQMRPDSHAAIVSWARPSGRAEGGQAGPIEPSFTLHEEFCSRPLPRMVQRPSVGSGVETELVLGAVGRPGAATLYTSQSLPLVKTAELARFETNNIFCIPVEMVVFDVLIPSGWSDPATARAECYGRRYHPEHVFERRPADLLPQRVSLARLGEFSGLMPEVKDAPRHAEAVARVLEEVGHADTPFDVYRCVKRYPVLHTLLALGVERVK